MPHDLMLGDWVKCPEVYLEGRTYPSEAAMVVSLDGETIYTTMMDYPFGPNEYIEPISLTKDILEKNGFKSRYSEYWKHTHYKLSANRHLFHIWEKDEVFRWHIGEARTKLEIKYVHQLQHILKWIGYEKKIVL